MGLPSAAGRDEDAPDDTAPSPAFLPAERRGRAYESHHPFPDDTPTTMLFEERGRTELTPKDGSGGEMELDMLTELVSTGNTPWFVLAKRDAPHTACLDLGSRCTSRVDLYKRRMQTVLEPWSWTSRGAQQRREQEGPAAPGAASFCSRVTSCYRPGSSSVPPPIPQRPSSAQDQMSHASQSKSAAIASS